jgi:hypothetical protein
MKFRDAEKPGNLFGSFNTFQKLKPESTVTDFRARVNFG